MFKIELQLEPKRKALYEEAIRRLRHVCVSDAPDAHGRIAGASDAVSDQTIPCLVDRPEILDENLLSSWIQSEHRIMPAHEWRFHPKVVPMYEALTSGKLGKPGLLRLHDWSATHCSSKHSMFGPVDLACWFYDDVPKTCHSVHANGSFLCHLQFPSDGMALLNVANGPERGMDYESIQLIGSTGTVYGDDHHNTHLQFKKAGLTARIHHMNRVHSLMGVVNEFVNGLLDRRDWNVTLKDTLRMIQQMKGVADG